MVPLLLLFLSLFSSLIAGLSVSPRSFLGCSLVLEKIHCYGGLTGSIEPGVFNNPTADHIILDLQKVDYQNLSATNEAWALNTGATGSNLLVPNGYQLTSSALGNSKFLVYGGYGAPGSAPLANPFLMYDPPTNTWSSVSTYNNSDYTVIGAISDITDQQSLWVWGGNSRSQWNDSQVHAPNIANIYNYGTNQWHQAPGDTVNNNVRFSYTATLGTNHRIYIIGGFEAPSGVNVNLGPVSMMQVRWFDTSSGAWGTDTATVSGSTDIVMPRAYHTTTQVPGSTSFVVYGGSTYIASQNTIPADYAYLYDYNSKIYTVLALGDGGAGRRSAHCAVPYKNYIFYLFGFDASLQLRNDINVLDVSNATHPIWVTPSQGTPSQGTSGSNSTTSGNSTTSATNGSDVSGSSDGLSKGATAGIAVAAVIAGLGLIFAGIYLFYRRRKQNKQFELEQIDPRATSQPFQDDSTAVMLDSPRVTPHYLQDAVKPSSNQRDPTSKPFGNE